MINIAFFIYSLNFGGAEKVLLLLLKHLSRKDFTIRVVVRKAGGELRSEVPADVIFSEFPNTVTLWNPLQFRRAIKNFVISNRISIVCCFGPELGIMSLLSGIKDLAKIFITEHTIQSRTFSNTFQRQMRKLLIRIFYRHAHGIIGVSGAVKENLCHYFSVPNLLISVINNPIDLSKFVYVNNPQNNDKQDGNGYTIVSCGRLIKPKNFDGLLRAFKKVHEIMPCRLIIIGEGEEHQHLYDLANELKISRHVEFTGYREDTNRFYSIADLFVLNSSFEGFGNVIVEAMACGLPVIATKCGGPEDIVIDGENGLLIPSNDENALARSIVQLLSDKNVRHSMAQKASVRAKLFSAEVITEKYAILFKSSLVKRRRILVLPAISRKKYLSSSNERNYFSSWPHGSYALDTLGAFRFKWSKTLFAKHIKFYPIQGLLALFWLCFKRYDLIIAWGSQSVITISLIRSVFKFNKPKILVFDVEKLGRKTSGLQLHVIRKACESIDVLIYHSSAQQRYYSTFIPSLTGKTRFMPLGIPPEEKTLPWNDEKPENYIVALGTPQTSRVQRKIRDWKTIIRASHHLPGKIQLKIYGKESFNQEETDGILPSQSVELFGYTPKKILSPIIERSLFALLPLWETEHSQGQLSLLYLMSLGKTVLVGRTTGIEDYIVDGETGLFYEPGNTKDLIEKIHFLYEHPEIISRISHAAYETVRNKFNIANTGQELFRIIDNLH
jgi:glycosyltransferase involved in cell wall biosynthesis